MIRLQNPTDESLVLAPHCSNTANYSLELDNSKQILLASSGVLEIPLKFTPSAIGQLHSAEISFHCPQVDHLYTNDISAVSDISNFQEITPRSKTT